MKLFERLFSPRSQPPAPPLESAEKRSWARRNAEEKFDELYELFVAEEGGVMVRLKAEGGKVMDADAFLKKLARVAEQYEDRIERPEPSIPTGTRTRDRVQESAPDTDNFALEQTQLHIEIARRRIDELRNPSPELERRAA